MSHHRWTIKELNEKSDRDILLILVNERRNELTNMYSPLSQRLEKIDNNLRKGILGKEVKP